MGVGGMVSCGGGIHVASCGRGGGGGMRSCGRGKEMGSWEGGRGWVHVGGGRVLGNIVRGVFRHVSKI